MDFCPIQIFNNYISKPCGKYYVGENETIHSYSILIFLAKIAPTNIQTEKIAFLSTTLASFRDAFLNSSTKEFDIIKVDHITRKMDPIKKELFKLVLIRYYQILTFEFSRYFTNMSDFLSFCHSHLLNEKILINVKYFKSYCDISIFSSSDFSFDDECVHHSLLHKTLISNILHNVNLNNGIEFPD